MITAMHLWERVKRIVLGGVPQHHAFSSGPKPIDAMFAELQGRGRTPKANRVEALTVPAILRSRNLICSVATLPLQVRDPSNRVIRSPLFTQIDPDIANVVTLAQTFEDLLMDSIAWWRVLARGFDGYPTKARRVDPNTVSLDPPPGSRSPAPLPSGQDPRGARVWIDGEEVAARDVIRFDSPNPSVLAAGGRAILRAILLDQTARLYADDPRPLDYFTLADDAEEPKDDEIELILAAWKRARQLRKTGYVPKSLQYVTVDQPSPADLQLVELQKQSSLETANMTGLDPEDLGVSTTSRSYSNVIDRRRDRINDVLAPYMAAIAGRLSMGDVTKLGYLVGWDLDDYLKSNPTERWHVYEVAHRIGAITVEEIRKREGWEPMDTSQPAQAVTPQQPADPQGVEARKVVALRFDAPTSHEFTWDRSITRFSVDTQKRTINGTALPYGVVGVKYGLKFRFRKGSLQYGEVSRVKHFKDHVTPVGKALNLVDGDKAFTASLSVANGATGDELLQLADDGVYDGLSVGVDFSLDPDDGDVELADDGVYDVLRADLREISTTAMPAFDDARVTSVAASRDRGAPPMEKCATCGTEHAANVACAVALQAAQQQQQQQPAPPVPVQLTAEQHKVWADLAGKLGLAAPPPHARD